jgi:hypothetical protein
VAVECRTAVPDWVPGNGEGTEHIRPEDTFDADYGALLARFWASGKVVTSPAGFEPALPA